jgi:hypothetical protein
MACSVFKVQSRTDDHQFRTVAIRVAVHFRAAKFTEVRVSGLACAVSAYESR